MQMVERYLEPSRKATKVVINSRLFKIQWNSVANIDKRRTNVTVFLLYYNIIVKVADTKDEKIDEKIYKLP